MDRERYIPEELTEFGEDDDVNTEPVRPVLSEYDRERLQVGARGVMEKVLHDFPDELPKRIILPDTSARPLVYLFKPIFEQVAATRHIETPEYHFIATKKHNECHPGEIIVLKEIEELKTLGQIPNELESVDEVKKYIQTKIELLQEELGEYPTRGKTSKKDEWLKKSFTVGRLKELLGEIKRLDQGQRKITERIRELVETSDGPVIVIDEYAFQGNTAAYINRVAKQQIPTYVLMAKKSAATPDSPVTIQAGSIDRDPRGTQGFLYREEAGAIGVTKNEKSPLSLPIKNGRNVREMAKLRNEMGEIGQKIAEEIITKTHKKQ